MYIYRVARDEGNRHADYLGTDLLFSLCGIAAVMRWGGGLMMRIVLFGSEDFEIVMFVVCVIDRFYNIYKLWGREIR